jgi:hypothetical protein
MLMWTGRDPQPRQEVRGLIVRPLYAVPKPVDLGPPRWFAPLTLVLILAFLGAGAWTVMKALDLALVVWMNLP